jgi:cytochrome c oxidase cbb3-type subunit 4
MFKHYFEGIPYIEVGPVMALIIFLLFSVGLLYWVFTADKSYIDEMSDLPLDDDEITKTET